MTEQVAVSGHIAELWRYPVKSMGGERCDALEMAGQRVVGDRLYAVRNPRGELGSGKDTRRFRRMDGLLECTAAYQAERVPAVRFPDGRSLRADAAGIDAALSAALGQPVTLAQEDDISHFDAAPIHLLTTASLAWLRAALPTSVIDTRRFRPNLVLDWPGAEPVEQGWCGKTLRLGATVRLRVLEPTERCGMVTRAQGTLPRDLDILRRIAFAAGSDFGVYAQVEVPGVVRLGDAVSLG